MPIVPSRAPAPKLTRSSARIVWSAMAAAMVIAVVASIAVAPQPSSPDPALARIFLVVVAAMTAIDLVAVYVVTGVIRRKAGTARGTPLEAAPGVQVIVACSLAMGVTLFACIAHFVTREPLLLAFVLPCAAVLLHWFPSRSRWARITPAPAAGSGAPRSMIRE